MTTMTKAAVRDWLLNYAWFGTPEEQSANVDCILAQDGWRYVDDVADQFAGAQEEPGPAAFTEGVQFALSALYECHEGPHLPTCPLAQPADPPGDTMPEDWDGHEDWDDGSDLADALNREAEETMLGRPLFPNEY